MPPDPRTRILQEAREVLAPLKRYRVESVLGRGGMGYVVKVKHEVLGLRAIKLISPSNLSSRTLSERFFNEARVMGKLRNPHVVEVYEVDDAQGYPYIIMEYLEGGTLSDHLCAFGSMPPRQAIQVALALLAALHTAHTLCDAQGKSSPVVHRDVKPDNVLLTKDGVAKLGDFGIAHIEDGTRQLTSGVQTLGTVAFMAPEQRDAKNVDARADVFSVGVVLYVMLIAPEDLWRDTFHETLGRNPDMMVGVLPELEQVIRTATAEDREARYPSAQAMAEALRGVLDSLEDDPQNTHALGSAPLFIENQKALAGEEIPFEEPHSPTVAPEISQSSDGLNRSETFHDGVSSTQFRAEVNLTRSQAKRKFFTGLGVLSVILAIVGAAIWFVTNRGEPLPSVVDVEPVVEVQSLPEQTVPAQTSPLAVKPAVTPVTVVAPEVKSQKKTVKTITPEVHPEATPEAQKAQVHLVLKEGTIATVVLKGEAGTFTVSPSDTSILVPPGSYQASVQMEGREGAPQTGTLIVNPGGTTITCTIRFQQCTGLK